MIENCVRIRSQAIRNWLGVALDESRLQDMNLLNQWIGGALKRGAIAVLTHRNGDMDTVGSACALAQIIGSPARACGIHLSSICLLYTSDAADE